MARYNPNVVTGKEAWLKEDITNVETFTVDFTTFRKFRSAHVGGIFISVKNIFAYTELWVVDDFEVIAVEVERIDPKYTGVLISL